MILDPDWLVSAFELCHLDVGCLVFVTNNSHREKPFSPSFVYIYDYLPLVFFLLFLLQHREKTISELRKAVAEKEELLNRSTTKVTKVTIKLCDLKRMSDVSRKK